MPWARTVENRLGNISATMDRLGIGSADTDTAVFAEYDGGQNILTGVNGRVIPPAPVAVQYASSTGFFEVTVSLAGMVRDGGVLGAGFESNDYPLDVQYDIPHNGVVFSAPLGQTAWLPFAQSYSTIISARPGVQRLSLYLWGNMTAGGNSAGYLKRARLSIQAV